MRSNFRKIVSRIALWIGVIAAVLGGALLFRGKHYAWISLCVAVLVLVPVFGSFEKRDTSSKELVVLCVMIALSAAGLAGPMRKSRAVLCAFGAAAGVLFSLLMDIWTVLWADGTFNLARYAAAVVSALPVTAEYAVSNVIFLLILANPIGEKLERMKKKYGLFVSA